MKIRLKLFVLFFLFMYSAYSQDTIKVMHYNLMYYGKNVYECTSTTNNIDNKNRYLKTIIQHVQPDILAVNELDGEAAYPVADDAKYLLDNALNVDGVNYYKKTETPKIYLANIVYYNANKLKLKNSYPISFYYGGLQKIFNVYKFFYNSDDLETSSDTAFIYYAVAHLKAGNGDLESAQRSFETSLIVDYFESLGEKGNYIVSGDFNIYSPTETCFQNFINPDNSLYTFYDPANQIGEWSANYNYRFYHTQSTHSSGDCHSGGGMDDRFDFILASDNIMNGSDHFEYIANSYKTIGQDGSSYNQSLNTSSNASVPNSVAQALYNMSDHLPVYLELEVDQNRGEPLGVAVIKKEEMNISFNNPVGDHLKLNLELNYFGDLYIEIYSIQGEFLMSKKIQVSKGENEIGITFSDMIPGMYLINIRQQNRYIYSEKFIKN